MMPEVFWARSKNEKELKAEQNFLKEQEKNRLEMSQETSIKTPNQ